MTTIVLARGSDWGIFANHGVYANWGECGEGSDVDATYKMLGDIVVSRLEELARNLGYQLSWLPGQSEVIGQVGQDIPDCALEELLEEASTSVWDDWSNGDIEPIMA